MGARVSNETPQQFAQRAKDLLLVSELMKRFDEIKVPEGEPSLIVKATKARLTKLHSLLTEGFQVPSFNEELHACETVFVLLDSLPKV
jgi:hypothetical protein